MRTETLQSEMIGESFGISLESNFKDETAKFLPAARTNSLLREKVVRLSQREIFGLDRWSFKTEFGLRVY